MLLSILFFHYGAQINTHLDGFLNPADLNKRCFQCTLMLFATKVFLVAICHSNIQSQKSMLITQKEKDLLIRQIFRCLKFCKMTVLQTCVMSFVNLSYYKKPYDSYDLKNLGQGTSCLAAHPASSSSQLSDRDMRVASLSLTCFISEWNSITVPACRIAMQATGCVMWKVPMPFSPKAPSVHSLFRSQSPRISELEVELRHCIFQMQKRKPQQARPESSLKLSFLISCVILSTPPRP